MTTTEERFIDLAPDVPDYPDEEIEDNRGDAALAPSSIEDLDYSDAEDKEDDEESLISEAKTLTFQDIASTDDANQKWVWIPEWNGKVLVRSITTRQMDIILAKSGKNADRKHKIQMHLVIAGMADPKINERQYQLMLDKSYGAVGKIVSAINEVSGFSGEKGQKKREERFPSR